MMFLEKTSMRKISAHFIHDGLGNCYNKGILTVDADGTILDIEDTRGLLNEQAGVEFFSGVIVPGFINAHCHLELSHLRGFFNEGEGFVPFLKKVVENRMVEADNIVQAAAKADLIMQKNGIVAVGDISNGQLSFQVKHPSKINYFTFVEALGFSPERSEKAFDWAKQCVEKANDMGLQASVVPHSPYSVSQELFHLVAEEARISGLPISIHNQESSEEDELFRLGTGEMRRHLEENLFLDTSFFHPTGMGAMQSTLKHLPMRNNLLLVHNIYTNQLDIDFIEGIRSLNNTWFVLCPSSNLYIQNRLPDIGLFHRKKLQICLGTDSLASNHQLSILEEMKVIQASFPNISLQELIGWACFNGARALEMGAWAGSIEVGKRPGLNLLSGLDLGMVKLQPKTTVKKLC
jgi:cytosine/adenosine deaminase-related metal-dependent hydrolase